MLLIGSPGSGKSMLAKRLPSILPQMRFEEMIETTEIHSVDVYKRQVEKIREDENCFAAAISDGGKYPQLVPVDEGSVIDLGGGVTVDVLNLGGHTENSVVFACAHYKACLLYTSCRP